MGNRSIKDPITYKGVTYKNGHEFCEALNIPIPTFNNRYIRSGWDLESVINVPIRRRKIKEIKDHLGNPYVSETEMCSAYDIPYFVYASRKKRGNMTLEEMLTTPAMPTVAIEHTNPFTGEHYSSERKMAKALGLSRGGLSHRIEREFEDEYLYVPKKEKRLQRKENKTYKPCKDHKGIEYLNKNAKCRAYNISHSLYDHRIKQLGWTEQEALETPVNGRRKGRTNKRRDHKGRLFPTQKKMCEFYGIPNTLYHSRRKKGWTKKRALTTPNCSNKKDRKPEQDIKKFDMYAPITDHEGTRFENCSQCCEKWGITVEEYKNRYFKGWCIEDILTTPIKRRKAVSDVEDHLGNKYASTDAMCAHYNLPKQTYYVRKSKGKMTLEQILTTPVRKHKREHINPLTGEHYNSDVHLAKAMGVSRSCIASRVSRGCKEEELYAPKMVHDTVDHLGNRYDSEAQMCESYNILHCTYHARIKNGWSKEKALTTPVIKNTEAKNEDSREKGHSNSKVSRDHKGNEFPTKTSMRKVYGLSRQVYTARLKKGMSQKEALETPVGNRFGR